MCVLRITGLIVIFGSIQGRVAGDEPIHATPAPLADSALFEHLGIHFIAFDFTVEIDSPSIIYAFETNEGGKLISETEMRTLHRPKSSERVQFNLLFSEHSSSGEILITVKHSHGTSKDVVVYSLSPPLYLPSYMDKAPSNDDDWRAAALRPALKKLSIETRSDLVPFDVDGRLVLAAEPHRGSGGIRSPQTISTAARALVLRLKTDKKQTIEE